MTKFILMQIWVLGALSLQSAKGEDGPLGSAPAAIRSSAAVMRNPNLRPTPTMIEHRARILGNHASASATRYSTVRDADILGKTEEEALKRLSPVPIPADTVRQVEVIVDLARPVIIHSHEPVFVGTAVIEGRPNNLEVHSTILNSELIIKGK